MTTKDDVVTIDAVRRAGVVNITRNGIPFSVVVTPTGDIKAFIAICPHDWILMHEPAVQDGCLVCPLHEATFSVCSGDVVDTRGKRIHEGLLDAEVDLQDGCVLIRVEPRHHWYFASAQAKRAGHAGKGVRRGLIRLLKGGA